MNKDYFPLIAAAMTGGATLIGVIVASFVLRFNYRSLRNPTKVELYKKQLEGMCKIAHFIKRSQLVVYKWYENRSVGLDDEGKNLFWDFHRLVQEYEVILPAEVVRGSYSFLGHIAVVNRTILDGKEAKQAFDAEMAEMHKLFKTCRKYIGADILTDDMEAYSELKYGDIVSYGRIILEKLQRTHPQK